MNPTKSAVMHSSAEMNLGKSGLTETAINEIKERLKRRKLMKIKMLKSFVGDNNRKEQAKLIANKTEARLISQVGNALVLAHESWQPR